VRQRPAVDPELAERPVRVAEEEAADHGFLDAGPPAPDVQSLGPREVHDPGTRGAARVANRVQRRHLAVGEGVPPEQVLDPVPPRAAGSILGVHDRYVV
jgi:hypothetical protein